MLFRHRSCAIEAVPFAEVFAFGGTLPQWVRDAIYEGRVVLSLDPNTMRIKADDRIEQLVIEGSWLARMPVREGKYHVFAVPNAILQACYEAVNA